MKDNKALKYLTLITGVLTLLLGVYTLVRPMRTFLCHRMDPGNPSVCKWY